MTPAPRPPDEEARLDALRRYDVLDTAPEAPFDELVQLAARLLDVPIALVSLVDRDRQWFKARVGLDAAQTPRDVAFCAHAVCDRERPLVVQDAATDPRFKDNPLVTGAPGVRFYAGAPLVTPSGQAIGTLCAIDRVPRTPSPEQVQLLGALARQAVAQLELRSRVSSLEGAVRARAEAEAALRSEALAVHAPGARRHGSTLAAAGLGLAVTLAAFGLLRRQVEELRAARTARLLHDIRDAIGERLAGHERLVAGTAAFVAASERVERDEWRAYVQGLDLARRAPDVVGLGYVARVGPGEAAAFEEAQRRTAPGYALHPARPAGEERWPLVFAEPLPRPEALGFDNRADDVRRAAFERASASGQVAATPPLRPMIVDGQPGFGLIVRVPGKPGWTYASIHTEGLLADLPVDVGPLTVELHEEGTLLDRAGPEGQPPAARDALDVGGRTWTVEVRGHLPLAEDARPWTVLLVGGLLTALAATLVRSLALTRDRAQELAERMTGALRVEEARTRALMHCVADGVVGLEADGRITALNPSAEALLGLTEARAQGLDVRGLLPGLGLAVGPARRIRLRRPGGDLVLAATITSTADARLACVLRDVTADQALAASEARVRAIIDGLPVALVVVDEEGRLEQANPAAERLLGAWDRLRTRRLDALLPGLVDASSNRLSLAPGASDGVARDLQARTVFDTEVPVEVSCVTFEAAGEPRWALLIRDVSERLEVDRLKREFVSIVSHELRTPLTSIRGSLGLALGGVLGDLPGEAREVLEIAERNAQRLSLLINDILDLERLERGQLELSLQAHDVAGIVGRAVESVRGVAEAAGVAIEARPSKARALCDAERVVQVLVNLLANAVKFSPRDALVVVSVTAGERWVKVRVTDRGRGIPEGFRERLFQPFQQVQASDAREKGGTGLGLAISRQIIERHGGQIGCDSQVGAGSTFWFTLPATGTELERRVATGEMRRPPSPPRGLPGSTVVVVDDDLGLLAVLSRQLETAGHTVTALATGAGALQAIERARPDLLVLDVDLPDKDGFQVVAVLRARPGTRDLPLLVHSGVELDAAARERLQLGPTRFLTKTRDAPEAFASTVLELLRGEAPPEARA